MLNVEGTDKLVQIVAADWICGGLALSNCTARFEAVFCRKVNLAPGLVNVQAGLLVAQRDEKVRHESPEEVTATVVVLFENANRNGV